MRRIFSLLVQAERSRLPMKNDPLGYPPCKCIDVQPTQAQRHCREISSCSIASVFNRCRHSCTAAKYPPARSHRCSTDAGTAALPQNILLCDRIGVQSVQAQRHCRGKYSRSYARHSSVQDLMLFPDHVRPYGPMYGIATLTGTVFCLFQKSRNAARRSLLLSKMSFRSTAVRQKRL